MTHSSRLRTAVGRIRVSKPGRGWSFTDVQRGITRYDRQEVASRFVLAGFVGFSCLPNESSKCRKKSPPSRLQRFTDARHTRNPQVHFGRRDGRGGTSSPFPPLKGGSILFGTNFAPACWHAICATP